MDFEGHTAQRADLVVTHPVDLHQVLDSHDDRHLETSLSSIEPWLLANEWLLVAAASAAAKATATTVAGAAEAVA
jgi:hypothetical protein